MTSTVGTLFEGWLPAAEGQVVVNALERMMRRLPCCRRKTALTRSSAGPMLWWGSARPGSAQDPDPDRATVVVHVPVEVLMGRHSGSGSVR